MVTQNTELIYLLRRKTIGIAIFHRPLCNFENFTFHHKIE